MSTNSIVNDKPLAHTAGPWTVGYATQTQHDYPSRYLSESVSIHGPGHGLVATAYGGHKYPQHRPFTSIEEGRANASLIAAAPDLLAACRRFVEIYDDVFDMVGPSVKASVEHARAAIAKAEGR